MPALRSAKTQAVKGTAHRVVGNGAVVLPLTGEHVATMTCEWLQLTQHRHSLDGQGHDVGFPVQLLGHQACHLGARNGPECPFQVELGPLHHAQVARTLEQDRRKQQSGAHDRTTLVGVHGPQQLTKALRFHDSREVLSTVRGQALLQALGNVPLRGLGGGQPVLVNLPRQHQPAVGRLDSTPPLDLLKHRQQLHGLDAAHVPLPQPGKQIALQLTFRPVGMSGAPAVDLSSVPFQGHGLEGVTALPLALEFVQLAGLHKIHSGCLLQPGRISRLAGISEPHGRVAPQGQATFLAIGVGLPEPAPGTARAHLQIQPLSVGEAGSLFIGWTGGAFALLVGQHGRALQTGNRLRPGNKTPGNRNFRGLFPGLFPGFTWDVLGRP